MILNPAILFPSIWILVVALSPVVGLGFEGYSEKFYYYIAASLAVFSMSSVLGGGLSKIFPLNRFIMFRQRFSFRPNINIYIAVMLAAILVRICDHAIMLGSDWWTPANIVLYRYMVFEQNVAINFAWVSLFNFFFFTAMPAIKLMPANIYQKIIVCLLILVFVYLSSARASIFVIVLVFYFFDWMKSGFKIYLTLISVGFLIFIYTAIAIMTEKVGDQFGMLSYALAPSHAFDQILNEVGSEKNIELYTFPFFHNIIYLMGWISEMPSRNLGFYATPIPTNVYTVFGPYVLDFGVIGSFIFLAGIGLVCGLIYKLSQSKENYLIFMSSMVSALLLLSVFHDYFTSAGFVWISAVLGFFYFPAEPSYSNQKFRRY
jgi:oligosaccharide repeat unit polymerase